MQFVPARVTTERTTKWGTTVNEPVNGASRQPTDVDRIVGAALKRHRRACGLTQIELGERVGKSRKQIRKYEYGENRITAGMLKMLADELEIGVDELFADLPMSDFGDVQSIDDEMRELAASFGSIKNDLRRKALLATVKEYAASSLNS